MPLLTAVLCALLFCCIRSFASFFNINVANYEQAQDGWWRENREDLEAAEEQAVAEMEASAPTPPWEGNSRQEGFTPAKPAMEITAAYEPTDNDMRGESEMAAESEPESPSAFPEDISLDYQPGLPAAAQVRRHNRYWFPRGDSFLINPWLYGLPLLLTVVTRLVGVAPHVSHPHPALLAIIIAAIPICHLMQTTSTLGEFTSWAHVAPLRWPQLILTNAFVYRRPRLAVDLALLLALVLAMDCPPVLLPLFPMLFIMNRLTLGLFYSFSARARAGGSRVPYLILAIPFLVLWLVAAICVTGILYDNNQSNEMLFFFLRHHHRLDRRAAHPWRPFRAADAPQGRHPDGGSSRF